MTNGNDLAHPTNIIDPDRRFESEYHTGLSKREYFSAMALQGICATFSGSPNAERQAEKVGKTLSETMAIYAVDVADALINALNEKP